MYSENHNWDTEKLLDDALSSDPGYALPDGFAERMAEKMGRKFAWQQYFEEFLIYLGAIAGIVAVSGILGYFWFKQDWPKWMDFLASNISLVVGINVLLIFILFADQVLLRYFFYRAEK